MGRWKELALVAALLVVTAVVFSPVAGHALLGFDDGIYVLDNPRVLAGLTWEGARWAFSSWEHASFYHPLTWLSLMLDVELFGVEGEVAGLPASGWLHLSSLAWHLAGTALLFAFLRAATGAVWRSLFAAALFALHPLHVESVAWVAERKDVLSTALGFACLWAYVGYARAPGAARYLLVAALLALGLLAKPMLVTWPFVLLLLDAWPLERARAAGWRRLVVEKLPLFALIALSSALSYAAQQGAAMHLMERLTLGERLGNAAVSAATYLVDTLWPRGLAPLYLYRPLPAWQVGGALLSLVLLSVLALRAPRRRPWLAVGWLFYLGTLVPVSGVVQVGLHARADRYTYVPLVGVFLALAWSAGELAERRPRWRGAVAAACGAALLACALLSARQVGYWRDTVTLFERTVAVTGENGWARRILGTALAKEGRHAEALVEYERALRAWPEDPIAHANLASSLAELGRGEEALAAARAAVRLAPEEADFHAKLGTLLARGGALEDSLAAFEAALALEPAHMQALVGLGKSLALVGRMEEAAACFERATRVEPANVAAWNNLAAARAATGRMAEALAAAGEALRLAREGGDRELERLLEERAQEYRRAAR